MSTTDTYIKEITNTYETYQKYFTLAGIKQEAFLKWLYSLEQDYHVLKKANTFMHGGSKRRFGSIYPILKILSIIDKLYQLFDDEGWKVQRLTNKSLKVIKDLDEMLAFLKREWATRPVVNKKFLVTKK